MAIVAVAILVFAYSYFIDTTQAVFAPKCFFFQMTGFKCPGCGTQRALHELAHLRIFGVARYNPFLFFAIPYLLLLSYLEFLGGNKRTPRLSRLVYSRWGVMSVFWAIIAYWVLRNVFGW